MEEKKFCKYCGEEIENECVICPKCGRQVETITNKEEQNEVIVNKSNNPKTNKVNFYEQTWFMWLMLILCAPIGILFMWKFHSEMKKKTKIILTIVFGIFFIYIVLSSEINTSINTNYEKANKPIKEKVTVIDFSKMEKDEIDTWCEENKVKCIIDKEYSDTIAKGEFVRQSEEINKTIFEGDRIYIIYSLGKEPSIEYKNALAKAESYSKMLNMSKKGIYDQLTSQYGEKFSKDAAQYAIDNIEANWNENALKKAESYSETLNMSKKAIYDQLTSQYGEKFTKSEAQYAIDNIEANWNENALAKAKSYQETLNMSKKAIYDQLTSQYGEKFTKSEAQYAIDHLND